jgi:hypothetical protein
MRFRNSLRLLSENFKNVYRLLIYKVVVTVVATALCVAFILPELIDIGQSVQFQHLVAHLQEFARAFLSMNTEALLEVRDKIFGASGALHDMLTYIASMTTKLLLMVLGCVIVYLLQRFVNTLSHFANYKLFLGVDSFSFDNGISTPNMEEAMLNQAMIAQASEVILVFDSSKFNKRSFCHIANVDQIHTIVTDHGLPVGSSSRLKEHNINLLLA